MASVQAILEKKGREVITVGADRTVLDAARLMNERAIGGLVVTESDRLLGIFTERDILRRVVAAGRDPGGTPIRDVMTTPVACCRPETTIQECRSVMTAKRIRHLPVVDGDGLCGIVTSGDVMAYRVEEHEDTIRYLESYVFGTR